MNQLPSLSGETEAQLSVAEAKIPAKIGETEAAKAYSTLCDSYLISHLGGALRMGTLHLVVGCLLSHDQTPLIMKGN